MARGAGGLTGLKAAAVLAPLPDFTARAGAPAPARLPGPCCSSIMLRQTSTQSTQMLASGPLIRGTIVSLRPQKEQIWGGLESRVCLVSFGGMAVKILGWGVAGRRPGYAFSFGAPALRTSVSSIRP